jgi:hypothetical protein
LGTFGAKAVFMFAFEFAEAKKSFVIISFLSFFGAILGSLRLS